MWVEEGESECKEEGRIVLGIELEIGLKILVDGWIKYLSQKQISIELFKSLLSNGGENRSKKQCICFKTSIYFGRSINSNSKQLDIKPEINQNDISISFWDIEWNSIKMLIKKGTKEWYWLINEGAHSRS